jgi:hypothetical protein
VSEKSSKHTQEIWKSTERLSVLVVLTRTGRGVPREEGRLHERQIKHETVSSQQRPVEGEREEGRESEWRGRKQKVSLTWQVTRLVGVLMTDWTPVAKARRATGTMEAYMAEESGWGGREGKGREGEGVKVVWERKSTKSTRPPSK